MATTVMATSTNPVDLLSAGAAQSARALAAGQVSAVALCEAAIDRIEVLTDGASALYGSDAIAGVVNFITRRGGSELLR
eukprot:gene180-biopygen130